MAIELSIHIKHPKKSKMEPRTQDLTQLDRTSPFNFMEGKNKKEKHVTFRNGLVNQENKGTEHH